MIESGAALTFAWDPAFTGASAPIYFGAPYQRLFSKHENLEPRVVAIQHNSQTWWLPVLLRNLGGDRKELCSAYGYGGIWPTEGSPPPEAQAKLGAFFSKEGIVCGFIRHTPFLMNHLGFSENASQFNRTAYVRDLSANLNMDEFCASVDQKLRWSINYARRNGLVVEFQGGDTWVGEDVRAFFQIYNRLMHGKNTDSFYLFSAEFFLDHGLTLGAGCELALVRTGPAGAIAAAAFFLLDPTGKWAHYHLSAADPAFLKLQPMELLLSEAAVRYGNKGFEGFHFGGGHSLDGSDGLSRFKRKFSTRSCPFHISKWIFNQEAYDQERARLPLKNPELFLPSAARGLL